MSAENIPSRKAQGIGTHPDELAVVYLYPDSTRHLQYITHLISEVIAERLPIAYTDETLPHFLYPKAIGHRLISTDPERTEEIRQICEKIFHRPLFPLLADANVGDIKSMPKELPPGVSEEVMKRAFATCYKNAIEVVDRKASSLTGDDWRFRRLECINLLTTLVGYRQQYQQSLTELVEQGYEPYKDEEIKDMFREIRDAVLEESGWENVTPVST